jgi:hypothetical protein
VTAGDIAPIVVTALDRFGNVATGYTGTVHLTATDLQAVLPADYAFNPGDAGAHSFNMTLKTSGGRTVSAADTGNASIGGNAAVSVAPAAPSAVTTTAGTPQQARTGTAFATPLSAAVQDAYGNPVPGVTVNFSAPATSPTGTFANGTSTVAVQTDANGVARAPAFTAGVAGGYTVTAAAAGVSAPAAFALTNLPVPAVVQSLVVNDGSAQRSMVTSITVTFNAAVTLPRDPATAFSLTGPNGAIALSVDLSQSTATRTVAKLTFTGPGVVAVSLADGRYKLRVLAAQVTDAFGQPLDGDGDGQPGGDYVSTPAANLFRLFGDSDGSGAVDALDLLRFRQAFGHAAPDPAYLAYFDYDGNGAVDALDLFQFRPRLGTILP